MKKVATILGCLILLLSTSMALFTGEEGIAAQESVNITSVEPQYQKLASNLQEKLTAATPDEKVKLWIWLIPSATEEQTVDKIMSEHPEAKGKVIAGRPNPAAENQDEVMSIAKSIQEEITEAHKKVYREVEDRVAQVLTARGFEIDGFSQYAPIIFAVGTKERTIELTKSSDVSAIYLRDVDVDKRGLQLDMAGFADKAFFVWSRGITGSDYKIAVVEDDGIAFGNPYLKDPPNPNDNYFNSGNPNVGRHATAVAGIIASQEPTFKGIAYGAPALLSANSQNLADQNLIDATEWALNNGARILNHSYGGDAGLQMQPLDFYLDHLVWHHFVTVVVAAGNSGTGTGNITSPGLGYNMITVGGMDDRNTLSLSDDVMTNTSSFNDPISTHMDREKPEVVAVGGSDAFPMTSTIEVAPWTAIVGSGTSLAAPQVAAEASLLMQRRPLFSTWPEAIKAIIMASAIHNIEGATRLSDRDGAGAIDVSKADDVANYYQWQADVVYSFSFPKSYQFTVPNTGYQQRVRVVISWDSHPDHNNPPSTDPLESDLDLTIRNSSGQGIAVSYSWDNNYEIAEFITDSGGTYTAEVSAYRFDGFYEYLGFAWARTQN